MANAEETATRLAYEFLRMGRYSAASGPIELPNIGAEAVAADVDVESEFTERLDEFSGLQIQSVGFEEGPEQPKVHIYLTQGSIRAMNLLPKSIDDVAVRTHKMGAISVRPEAAGTSTNRGNVFERNGRICCGTSCGPTSERGTGTFGAIVRMAAEHDLFLLSNNHVLAGCNHVPQRQPVLAPSSMDGRPDAPAPREIGPLAFCHRLKRPDGTVR